MVCTVCTVCTQRPFFRHALVRVVFVVGLFWVLALFARSAAAETYRVGPAKSHKDLQSVQQRLKPGDVVEVDGDATYPGGVFFRPGQSGTSSAKITVRGIKVNGKRPVISGGGSGVLEGLGMVLSGSHYVLESFEVTGASNMCVVHKADDITIRDFVVHDCPGHGLLGHDDEAGSLTLEHSEFYKCGNGTFQHQIYMTTGQEMYPGSVFRMQHCYVHDGSGGNNVKSRSERNEIHYNWIESAHYHNLELIGPDKSPATPAREDSDVVGNVIVGGGTERWHLVRVGGDKDAADTSGRYRFANNTFVIGAKGAHSVVRLMLRVDTLEMHNNAFVRAGEGIAKLFETKEVQWTNGPSIFGSNNWVQDGLTGAPETWSGTLTGSDAGLVDLAKLDLRLKEGSPLADKGAADPASVSGREFPSPLGAPTFVPPSRQLGAAATPRAVSGALDIGAFELGSAAPPPGRGTSSGDAAGGPNGGPGGAGAGAGAGAAGGAGGAGAGGDDGGCGCGAIGRCALSVSGAGLLAGLGALAIVARRRRRRSAD